MLGNPRIAAHRRRMLTLISAAIAFGVLAGLVGWQANAATYDAYHALVDSGSRSVDAALLARAAALDHMGENATFLATTDPTQRDAAAARAAGNWAIFSEESRNSWRGLSDSVQGEYNVYAAADSAASDYIQKIGAMYDYYRANPPQTAAAGQAFLSARDIMNGRLVPALGGLEAVKVEDMAATYAGASERITRWRWALTTVAVLLGLVLLGGLWAVRYMHYPWSASIGVALLATVILAFWMQFALARASDDAKVLVSDAYDTVAGVQDLAALLSQGRALESIAIFDADNAAARFQDFEEFNTLVKQKLCGPATPTDCTETSFLVGDQISPDVYNKALEEQSKLGLPKAPLVANVHFAGLAQAYEDLRNDYRAWLAAHATLQAQLAANQRDQALTTSTGTSEPRFDKVIADSEAVRSIARRHFDEIWQRIYTTSLVNEALALLFPLGGLLAASGLVRRRSELFI